MKKMLLFGVLFLVAGVAVYAIVKRKDFMEPTNPIADQTFHDLNIRSLDGKSVINFSSFKGKKVLIVNVASQCGYTPQYDELEKLYQTYKDKLVILGCPCNQFGSQEPGNATEIAEFCKLNYGVTFPLSEKIDVKGTGQHPVYQWLTKKSLNGLGYYTVNWNFNKFLIDENGKLLAYFESGVKPLDAKITALIQ